MAIPTARWLALGELQACNESHFAALRSADRGLNAVQSLLAARLGLRLQQREARLQILRSTALAAMGRRAEAHAAFMVRLTRGGVCCPPVCNIAYRRAQLHSIGQGRASCGKAIMPHMTC